MCESFFFNLCWSNLISSRNVFVLQRTKYPNRVCNLSAKEKERERKKRIDWLQFIIFRICITHSLSALVRFRLIYFTHTDYPIVIGVSAFCARGVHVILLIVGEREALQENDSLAERCTNKARHQFPRHTHFAWAQCYPYQNHTSPPRLHSIGHTAGISPVQIHVANNYGPSAIQITNISKKRYQHRRVLGQMSQGISNIPSLIRITMHYAAISYNF